MNLVERVSRVWNSMVSSSEMIIALVVSILVFTVMYYYMVKFLFDNNSGSMVMLFCFSMIIGAAILSFAGEKINSAVYLIIPAIFIIAILVLYSVEIKRIIWAQKNAKLADIKHGDGVSYDEERIQKCISEIIRALQNMSKNDVGAIVVLSTGNVPSQMLDSGVRLDS